VFRAILRDVQTRCEDQGQNGGEYLIRASDNVVDRLLDEDAVQLADLSQRIGREIGIQVEPSYGPGQFDVVVVRGARR
jgi:ribonuclease G